MTYSDLGVGYSDASKVHTLTIANGMTVVSNYGCLGHDFGGTGSASVNGANGPSTWTVAGTNMSAYVHFGTLYVGYYGSGILSITNGGTVNASIAAFASNGSATATLIVDGQDSSGNASTLNLPNGGSTTSGVSGVETITLSNGGTLKAASMGFSGGTTTAYFNGGVFELTGNTGTSSASANTVAYVGGSGTTPGLTVDTNGYSNTSFAIPLTHDSNGAATDGGLTKIGNGVFRLGTNTNANTYNGPTNVNGGVLGSYGDADPGYDKGLRSQRRCRGWKPYNMDRRRSPPW